MLTRARFVSHLSLFVTPGDGAHYSAGRIWVRSLFKGYGSWPNTVSTPSICRFLIETQSIPQAHADLDGSWFLLNDYQKQCITTRNKLQRSFASNLIVVNIPSVCIRLTTKRCGLSNWDLMRRQWGENQIRSLVPTWIYSWRHCWYAIPFYRVPRVRCA